MDGAAFEAAKIAAKKEWLAAISNSRYITTKKYGNCTPQENKGSRYKLADFDDMHCAFVAELDFIVSKYVSECGKTRIEFDAGRVSGKFNFKFDDKGISHFEKATIEATVIDKSITANKGPLQIGATVKAGVGVEFTNRGIEDVYVTGEASVSVKTNIIETLDKDMTNANTSGKEEPGLKDIGITDKGVEVGVTGKMSLISGNTSGGIKGFGK